MFGLKNLVLAIRELMKIQTQEMATRNGLLEKQNKLLEQQNKYLGNLAIYAKRIYEFNRLVYGQESGFEAPEMKNQQSIQDYEYEMRRQKAAPLEVYHSDIALGEFQKEE